MSQGILCSWPLRTLRGVVSCDPVRISVKAECAPSAGKDMAKCFPQGLVDLDTPPPTPPRKSRRVSQETPKQASKDKPVAPVRIKLERGEPSSCHDMSGTSVGQVCKTEASTVLVKQESCASPPGEHESIASLLPALPPKAGMTAKEKKQADKQERLLLKQGQAAVKAYKLRFNEDWFAQHKYHCATGHWQDFQKKLGQNDVASLDCEACNAVVSQLRDASPGKLVVADEPQPALAPSKISNLDRLDRLKKQEGLSDAAKGRRPRSAGTPLFHRLWDWLAQRRDGVYRRYEACKLYCTICDTIVDAKRESTCWFVLQHESYDRHWLAVHPSEDNRRFCKGIVLTAKPLTERQYLVEEHLTAFEMWMALDMPWACGKQIAHACYVTQDAPVVRCSGCEKSPAVLKDEETVCGNCVRLPVCGLRVYMGL